MRFEGQDTPRANRRIKNFSDLVAAVISARLASDRWQAPTNIMVRHRGTSPWRKLIRGR